MSDIETPSDVQRGVKALVAGAKRVDAARSNLRSIRATNATAHDDARWALAQARSDHFDLIRKSSPTVIDAYTDHIVQDGLREHAVTKAVEASVRDHYRRSVANPNRVKR